MRPQCVLKIIVGQMGTAVSLVMLWFANVLLDTAEIVANLTTTFVTLPRVAAEVLVWEGPGTNYTCQCQSGFRGTNCEDDVSVCNETPQVCVHGQCNDGVGLNYTCSCDPGFSGTNCSLDGMYCNETHCMNGATCMGGSW